jgi:type I restriction enzyme, R subunit
MDKKSLTEQDIRSKFISPAVHAAGWDAMRHVREEVQLTKGRVIVKGKLTMRGEAKRADYVSYHRSDLPIAVMEAKDNSHAVGAACSRHSATQSCLKRPGFVGDSGS